MKLPYSLATANDETIVKANEKAQEIKEREPQKIRL